MLSAEKCRYNACCYAQCDSAIFFHKGQIFINFLQTFREHIHQTLFFSQLRNVLNKLECLITIGWKGLTGTSTLAHWAHM
jgi:hypothetical protein